MVYIIDPPVKMKIETLNLEVGIEDCLHIYFEFIKSFYHLGDCIIGKVEFHEVKIKLKHAEVNIVK